MGAQPWYWVAGGGALLVAVIAGFADRRQQQRDHPDAIGWVPWRGVQVAAFFAAVAILILAMKL